MNPPIQDVLELDRTATSRHRESAAGNRLVTTLWQDVRYAARALRSKPVLSLAVIFSVVVGIGANAAIFTLMDALFLHPVPGVSDLDRLVVLVQQSKEDPDPTRPDRFSYPLIEEYRQRMSTLSDVTGSMRIVVSVAGSERGEQVNAMTASAGYLESLGLKPHVGRFYRPEEDRAPGQAPVAVLSHGFWQRMFGGDRGVVGEAVRVNGLPFTVVGVAQPGFHGTEVHATVDLWVPLTTWPALMPAWAEFFDYPDTRFFELSGRLAPGATREQADDEAQRVAAQLEQEYGFESAESTTRAWPLERLTILPRERDNWLGYGRALGVGVTLVLLICCVNVVYLLLVRGLDRSRELATRQALGASRGRLVRQLATEGLLLFVVGGVLAVGAAWALIRLLWLLRPPELAANAVNLTLNGRVVAFLFALTLVAGLVTSLWPAWHASRVDLTGSLRSGGHPAGGRRGRLSRGLLVAPQIALALAALVAGGIYLEALREARRLDVGFDPENLAVLTVAPGRQGYDPAQTRAYYERLLETTRRLPGVSAAGLSSERLLRGSVIRRQTYFDSEEAAEGDARPALRTVTATPGYFAAAGLEIVRGETFPADLSPESPPVVLINELLAEQGWPGKDPVGRHVSFDYPTEPPMRVIGVVEDAKYRYLDEDPQGFVYTSFDQQPPEAATLHVRTAAGQTAALLPLLRQEVQALDPTMPVADVGTMRSFVDEALWMERSSSKLVNAFGWFSLLLAVIGLYGMMRYSVRRREREIGVRLAVGAERRQILRQVLGESAVTTLAGLGLGLLVAVFVVRPGVGSQLVDLESVSPWVYALPCLLLFLVAMIAGYFPARRAARTDPNTILRLE